MRTGLAGVLSERAARLYERLVELGELPLNNESPAPDATAVTELIDKGFAWERHVGASALVPVEPAMAIDNAIMVRQRQILDQYQTLVRLRDEMLVLQKTFLSSAILSDDVADLITVVTDRREIGALSVEIVLSAKQDVARLETEHFQPATGSPVSQDVARRSRGVRVKPVHRNR